MAGLLGVILWSFIPLLVTFCADISLFLLLGTAGLVTFLLFAAGWVKEGAGVFRRLRVEAGPLVVATAGHGLYRALAWSALLLVSPVEASVLIYLWPATDVMFAAVLGRGSAPKGRHYAGLMMGIAGMLVVISDESEVFGNLGFGHLLAIAATVVWGVYAGMAHRNERYAGDAVAVAYLLSGIVFLAVAAVIERPLSMSVEEFGFVTLAALAGGAGSYLWGIGLEEGEGRSLGLWSLISPLLAVCWLVVIGGYELRIEAGIGAALVFAAGVVVSPHFRRKNVIKLQASGGAVD